MMDIGIRRWMRAVQVLGADTSGAQAIEFALVFPILAMMTLGMIDVGHFMWVRSSLENSAKEGARYASIHGSASDQPASVSDIVTFTNNRMVLDDSLALVNVSWTNGSNDPGETVTVAITYEFKLFLEGFLPLSIDEINAAASLVVLN